MLKTLNILVLGKRVNIEIVYRCTSTQAEVVPYRSVSKPLLDTRNLPNNDYIDEVKFEKKSVLDKCDEDISHVAPHLKPTFNFASYVNKSPLLQELLKLGVNLYKLEDQINLPPYILGLDFEKDIKKHVIFLHDMGLSVQEVGTLITKNPYIFKEDIENMKVRINYLKYKHFSDDMITEILRKNAYWLTFRTDYIDQRLGFFQKEFSLTGDEVRNIATRKPTLITFKMEAVKTNIFAIKEEMGFSPVEIKSMLMQKPVLFMKSQTNLLKTFEYIHMHMKIPLVTISKMPGVLTCRTHRLKERHLFLEKLGRAQYDPKKENYVSLLTVVSGTDAEFCENAAKSSIQSYNMFLKSL